MQYIIKRRVIIVARMHVERTHSSFWIVASSMLTESRPFMTDTIDALAFGVPTFSGLVTAFFPMD